MICMTLQKKLEKFGKTLANLPVSVFHYHRGTVAPPVAIWQEEGEGETFYADNGKKEPMVEGSLDYYTKTEYDSVADQIQQLLEENCDHWQLDSVQYEEDTGLIHFSWGWGLRYG